ncbi:MAG: mechanosensitive ion channel family protein [Planctomycetes bacterium]|nr:mechanosensitive ion channel family protein [Planctomycetota bacterium]
MPQTPPNTTPRPLSPSELQDWLTRIAIDWVGRVLAVLLVMAVAWMLAGWARRTVGRLLERPYVDRTLSRFLGNITRWLVLVVALIGCLGMFGFNITSVATVLGAAGLAIGLALQGSLSNLAAGVMLLLLRPFKIGDVVLIAGQIGKVDDIDLFQTKIDTGDNRRLILPNSSVFSGVVENWTHHPFRRCDVPVGVAYGADVAATRAALRRAGEGLKGRQPDKVVDVLLDKLGNSSVDWVVRVWVPTTEFAVAKDALVEAIVRELGAAGIAIPFPQLEVWFKNHLPAR